MRIAGRRADGALYLSIGAGHAVLLRGDRVSRPHDEGEIERMGPWAWSPDDSTFAVRQAAQRQVDLARVVALESLTLADAPPWIAKKITADTPEADVVVKDGGAATPPLDGEGLFAKKDDAAPKKDGLFVKKDDAGVPPKKDGLFVKKEKAVALDDSIPAEKDKDKTSAVSEIAQATQEAAADAPAPPAVMNLPPVPDERKKKRGELRDKIRVGLKSQRKVEDMLGDEELSDDDLYAMAKALGITDAEHPGSVKLVDNATKFQQLLSSTTHAKTLHLAAGAGDHPFTYCKTTVIPRMVAEGKGPDDEDAFCSWYKHNGPGAK